MNTYEYMIIPAVGGTKQHILVETLKSAAVFLENLIKRQITFIVLIFENEMY